MSDHFSGPRALAGPSCDISDLYAFPSPTRTGHLVLAMNVLPRATSTATFSDAIEYRFRLRSLRSEGRCLEASFPFGEDEIVVSCRFDSPSAGTCDGLSVQTARCTSPDGEEIVFSVHDELGGQAD